MRASSLLGLAASLLSPAYAQVVSTAFGMAAGTTGGGNAKPAAPADIKQLMQWLADSTPRVILIDKEFNFINSEGSATSVGCERKDCPVSKGGQDFIGALSPADLISPAISEYTTNRSTTNIKILSQETKLVSLLERVQCFKDPAEAEARVALLSNTDRINLARLGCRAASITAEDPALKKFCRGQQGRLEALREAVARKATTEADEEDLENLRRNRAWVLELLGLLERMNPLSSVQYDVAGTKPMAVGSNKSLVGVGSKGVIVGKGLRLNGATNVIIQNIHFTNINPRSKTDEIWIDHCKFSLVGRQFIVSGWDPAGHVTISNSEFDGITKWSNSCNGQDYWALLLIGSRDLFTFSGNWLHHVSGRAPHYGTSTNGATNVFHAVNNLFEKIDGHALDIEPSTWSLIEGNVFKGVTQPVTPQSTTRANSIYLAANAQLPGQSVEKIDALTRLTRDGGSNIAPVKAVSGVEASVRANAGIGKLIAGTASSPPTSPSQPPLSNGGAPLWGQCGGQGWTGPTTCAKGTCQKQNGWYSQCLYNKQRCRLSQIVTTTSIPGPSCRENSPSSQISGGPAFFSVVASSMPDVRRAQLEENVRRAETRLREDKAWNPRLGNRHPAAQTVELESYSLVIQTNYHRALLGGAASISGERTLGTPSVRSFIRRPTPYFVS
ncbi:pectin lyase fold/virulence factor [Ilyonectria sp. MPI-CAGE-AT-0026]|nr:pectin lyase fold/virulence factor [Ilyonectria sp. MPI-CAGE-AT-0026]